MVTVKLKCRECGFEAETEVVSSNIPTSLSPLSHVHIDKNVLDKILEMVPDASLDELRSLGIHIDKVDFSDARERLAIKQFVCENITTCREIKSLQGEEYVVGTDLWKLGDDWKDVDLPSSVVKGMGVDELGNIPGLTLQKKVYGTTDGRMTEELHGVKFIVLLDGSGSMLTGGPARIGKLEKALSIANEIHKICKRMNFKLMLGVFSDRGERVKEGQLDAFFNDEIVRENMGIWNGGTHLVEGLKLFSQDEYKDANVIILSDMLIGDIYGSKEQILEIARVTNNFKIVLILDTEDVVGEVVSIKELFPPTSKVSIFVCYVGENVE